MSDTANMYPCAPGHNQMQEAFFRRAFENAPAGMILLSPDLKILQVNSAFEKLLGFSGEELAGSPISRLILDEDNAPGSETVFQHMLAGHTTETRSEKYYVGRDGAPRYVVEAASLVRDDGGQPLFIVVHITDLTQRRATEMHLQYLAYRDCLTGVHNRRFFDQELKRRLAEAVQSGATGALLLLDLNEFKVINDTLGHIAGDRVLIHVASLLQKNIRAQDCAARLGGDEFAVILHKVDQQQAESTAARIVEKVARESIVVGRHRVNVTASVGVALFPQHGVTFEQLLSYADAGLYRVKGHHLGQQPTFSVR